jgi:hypothetical protein
MPRYDRRPDGLPAGAAAVPVGRGRGLLIGGDVGALWGAGLGVVLGLLLMALLIRAMRQR